MPSFVKKSMKKISTIYLLAIMSTAATVSFADDYQVNIPFWQSNTVRTTSSVNIADLKPGEKIEVGQYLIYRRTAEELEFISDNYSGDSPEIVDAKIERIESIVSSTSGLMRARYQLRDQPELEKNPYRSKRKEYLVMRAFGQYGCELQMEIPTHQRLPSDTKFYDPCTNIAYDLSGRDTRGSYFVKQRAKQGGEPTGEQLLPEIEIYPHTVIPPHHYLSDDTLVFGVSDVDALPQISLSAESLFSGLTPTELLLQATAFNDLNRAKNALSAGADVNAPGPIRDSTGSLPLLRAVLYSSMEMVNLLLSHGAVPGEDEKRFAIDNERYDVSALLERVRN